MIGKVRFIEKDLFNISGRLKAIDINYFILFNYKMKRFEVHNRGNRGSSYCLSLPFDRLDSRAVDYVNKTRSENAERIFLEIEMDNEKLIKNYHYQLKKQAQDKIEQVFRAD